MHVQSSGKKNIRGINLLVAMFQEKESFALYSILNQGVDRFAVVKAIAHGGDQPLTADADNSPIPHEFNESDNGERPSSSDRQKKEKRTPLDDFTTNTNEEARKRIN